MMTEERRIARRAAAEVRQAEGEADGQGGFQDDDGEGEAD